MKLKISQFISLVSQLTMSEVYIHDVTGVDSEANSGSKESPYKTPAYALFVKEDAKVFVYKKDEETDGYVEISASALKKAKKGAEGLKKKLEKAKAAEAQKAQREADDAAKKLEALKITIKEDESLPKAIKAKIRDLEVGKRFKVSGWIHRFRSQKGLAFIVLRDGTGYVQAVLSGDLANAYQTTTLTLESTVTLFGTVQKLPEGKQAVGGVELVVDYYEVIGLAPSGEDAFTNKIQEGADPSLL